MIIYKMIKMGISVPHWHQDASVAPVQPFGPVRSPGWIGWCLYSHFDLPIFGEIQRKLSNMRKPEIALWCPWWSTSFVVGNGNLTTSPWFLPLTEVQPHLGCPAWSSVQSWTFGVFPKFFKVFCCSGSKCPSTSYSWSKSKEPSSRTASSTCGGKNLPARSSSAEWSPTFGFWR